MTAAATGPCSHFVEGGSTRVQMKRQGALASPGGRTLKRLQYAPPTPQPRRMQGIHLDGYWEGAGRILEGEPEQDAGEPPGWSGLGSGVWAVERAAGPSLPSRRCGLPLGASRPRRQQP